MSAIQKIFKAVMPRKWSDSMEAESRSWMVRCSCGYARSIWDMGGIRWKAKGNQRNYMKCPKCGERSWHTTSYEPQNKL